MKLLLFIVSLIVRMPDLSTLRELDWEPNFTDPAEICVQQDTVAVLTHCSRHFDIAGSCCVGIDKLTDQCRRYEIPRLYLQDSLNPANPSWKYLYTDWQPTAFVHSDIGYLDINQSHIKHAIVCGGFFEQCERSTVVDLLNHWRRDAATHNFRITQVTDATFCVGQYLNYEDRYYVTSRDLLQKKYRNVHPLAPCTVAEILDSIVAEELFPDFLQRQLPPLPTDINVVLDVYGIAYQWQVLDPSLPTLTLAYRRSTDDLLKFTDYPLDFTKGGKPESHKHSSFVLHASTPFVQPAQLLPMPESVHLSGQPQTTAWETVIAIDGTPLSTPILSVESLTVDDGKSSLPVHQTPVDQPHTLPDWSPSPVFSTPIYVDPVHQSLPPHAIAWPPAVPIFQSPQP